MSNSRNNYVSLETLLNDLYCLFEFDSPVYTDELGYKWYRLDTVIDILNINEDEYINGYYLMMIEDASFISEEGINMLLIEYDNKYRDNILDLLAGDVMPDIKSDAMYLGNHLINDVRNASIGYIVNIGISENDMVMNKMKKYTENKMSRHNKKYKMKDSKSEFRK